jgi:DNA polymerase-3 subunit epsilon
MRRIFLDTETTGLSVADGDRVIELACLEVQGRRLTGEKRHYYLNPERDIHEEALQVHGLSREFLSDKPLFASVSAEFLAFVQGAQLIIHNAAFDMGFLNQELKLAGHPPLEAHVAEVVDTWALAKSLFPGKRNSLDALCDRLGIDRSARTLHGALLDTQLLFEVYIQLTRGQDSLLQTAGSLRQDQPQATALPVGLPPALQALAMALPTQTANAQELEAHTAVLQGMKPAKGQQAVW